MNLRECFYRSYRYLLILLVFLLPLLRNISLPASFGNNAYAYLLRCFGGLYAAHSIDVMYVILFLVPNLFLVYMFSDLMREDCLVNYVYVFPRMGKKQKWLFRKTVQLFLQVLIAYALLFALGLLLAKAAGMRFDLFDFSILKMLLDMFFFHVWSVFLLAFLQNFLSLSYGGTQSFLLVMLLYVISLVAALSFYNAGGSSGPIIALLIPSNQMYIWHSNVPPVLGAEDLLGNPLNGFRAEYSYSILIFYSVLCYRIARSVFLRRDSVEMMKGA